MDGGSELEREISRLQLARELRRILMLLCGEDWEAVYEDLIVNTGADLPTAEEIF